MAVLRRDLLAGRRVALAGEAGEALREALVTLGAQIEVLGALPGDEDLLGEWARSHGPLDALVYCASSAFGQGGATGLQTALEEAWVATREVATGAMIGVEGTGKLVLVAPGPQAGPLAEASRAGLESLVRTVSVEWARYGVTAVLIAPGARTSEEEIAGLSCFLCSEAGDYLSGCRLELGAVA